MCSLFCFFPFQNPPRAIRVNTFVFVRWAVVCLNSTPTFPCHLLVGPPLPWFSSSPNRWLTLQGNKKLPWLIILETDNVLISNFEISVYFYFLSLMVPYPLWLALNGAPRVCSEGIDPGRLLLNLWTSRLALHGPTRLPCFLTLHTW